MKIIDGMLDPVFPKRVLTTDAFNDIFGMFCSMVEEIEEFNILYGTLICVEVFRDMPVDDHTEEYYRTAKKNIIYGLTELTYINHIVNNIPGDYLCLNFI